MVSDEISHYRVVRKLGAGGMGEVYLAEDLLLNRKVAIKMLPSRSLGNDQAKRRLFREAQAAATLDHPNICAIHEIGEQGDSSFIVMQYIDGRTLASLIRNGPLPPSEVLDYGIQIAAALDEAHDHGIIHRDIKPQNIIVTPRGQVKVLDFGLAKIVTEDDSLSAAATLESRLTDTGEIVGTVGYMSPEQLKDLPIDSRTDLFSLGVTLYECATGKTAFSGSSKIQISLQVIQFDPPRPSQTNAEIPHDLDEIILKAIAKEPELRHQTAREMLRDLQSLQASLQPSASQTRPFVPERSRSRSSFGEGISSTFQKAPRRIWYSLAALILIALGGWIFFSAVAPSVYQPSSKAKPWYDQGVQELRAGTFYQASKNLGQAVSMDDRFAMAHARLAEAFLEIDNPDAATEEILKATALSPNHSGLDSRDALYLDALLSTVTRDFRTAIDYYTKLSDRASDADKASAYVDLGRAYEKDQQVDKAEEFYSKAVEVNSQLAFAHLRLAMIYGRKQDSRADDEFNQALSLYKTMSNNEGQVETHYQRGALFAKNKRLANAKDSLELALKAAPALDNKYQLVKTKLQLSGVYANQGDTELSQQFAQEAISTAQEEQIQSLVINGLIDLGYTIMSTTGFSEAKKLFQKALDFAQKDRAPIREARAKRALGSLNQQTGNSDEAISLLNDALKFYETNQYRREAAGALVLLGRAYGDKGDYEASYDKFSKTLELARRLDDSALEAACHSSIALLRGQQQERYPEALAELDESYKINERLQSKRDMAYDQMNRGAFLGQLGRFDEAMKALNDATTIAEAARLKSVLAWINVVNAQIMLSRRQFNDAKVSGRKAIELAGTDIKDVAIQARCVAGLAEANTGAPQVGQKLCEEAVTLSREIKSPQQLYSSSLLALAEVALLRNDAVNAITNAEQAIQMFSNAGQVDSEWRALAISARAIKLSGNGDASEKASKADQIYNGLREKWGAEAFESYSNRPDIRAYRDQINLLARSK